MSADHDDGLEEHADESPWISFSDAMSALLFIFITTTFWFMIQLQEIRAKLSRQADEQEQQLKRLTGADKAADALLQDVKLCLGEAEDGELRIKPVVDEASRTLSVYLEPQPGVVGEWFTVCSAAATPDAVRALETMRGCLAREVPTLAETYGVKLTLEGHTDARTTGGACAARFPSNWELSGARAGAALRRLLCEDGRCSGDEDAQAGVLRGLAQDSAKLQVVAAGRADAVPAWAALCDPAWPGAAVDPALDAAVCAALTGGGAQSRAEAAALIEAARGAGAGAPMTTDEAVIWWANAAPCLAPKAGPAPKAKARAKGRASASAGDEPGSTRGCEERLGRLRRVDLRVDLKPRATALVGAAAPVR
jgi:flagellar motor protein MotB